MKDGSLTAWVVDLPPGHCLVTVYCWIVSVCNYMFVLGLIGCASHVLMSVSVRQLCMDLLSWYWPLSVICCSLLLIWCTVCEQEASISLSDLFSWRVSFSFWFYLSTIWNISLFFNAHSIENSFFFRNLTANSYFRKDLAHNFLRFLLNLLLRKFLVFLSWDKL